MVGTLAALAVVGSTMVTQAPQVESAVASVLRATTGPETDTALDEALAEAVENRHLAEVGHDHRDIDPAQALKDLVAVDLDSLGNRQLAKHSLALQEAFAATVVDYEAAVREADEADDIAFIAEAEAHTAEKARKKAATSLTEILVDDYQSGLGNNAYLSTILSNPGALDTWATEIQTRQTFTETAMEEVGDLDRLSQVATIKRQAAARTRREANRAEAKADRLLALVQEAASTASASAAKAILGRTNEFGVLVDAAQQRRNNQALRTWRRYLDRLDAADVVPPSATTVTNGVPFGMKPLRVAGRPIPGVASVRHARRTLTVLPQETINAISAAFTRLGHPYRSPSADTTPTPGASPGFSCNGLTHTVFSNAGLTLPPDLTTQATSARTVPLSTLQPGDLVFFDAPDQPGRLQHVGINLNGSSMIAAEALSYAVGVYPFPGTPSTAVRPALPANSTAAPSVPAPASTGTDPEPRMECGAMPISVSAAGMQMPIAEGNYSGFSAGFGQSGRRWSTGTHTGLDFAADTGAPVMAAKSGTVSLTEEAWAGTLVTIDHGDGVSTRYAHMSQVLVEDGQRVQIGDYIGAVGEEGNVTGPHLHFEVLINDTPVDPLPYLLGDGTAAVGGWGGYSNGMIPAQALCSPTTAPGHLLRCDAAAAFDSMAAAYVRDTGTNLCITDSYRSFAAQVTTFEKKPTLAAVPGTSNHGWGLAVDLCGGIETFGSPGFRWMKANAAKYGYIHPSWASKTGSRPEPWHWEFGSL